jgi:Na+/H+ antiporter NhaD/arsenite permease-like protein
LTIEGWMTLGVIAVVFVLLARELAPPDVVMFGGTVFLGVTGVLTTEQALGGFANQGVLAIGALFVVAAGIRETGAMDALAGRMLGKARDERSALIRLVFSVVPLSAVMNNTPLVAMLLPVVSGWCRRNRVSPSRLLIPLSYLAILGGTLTLIGTSTTVVVNGLLAGRACGGSCRGGCRCWGGVAALRRRAQADGHV